MNFPKLGLCALLAALAFAPAAPAQAPKAADPNDIPETFVKPDADSKEFAGRVFAAGAFEPWLEEMRAIGYLPETDFAVAISEPKTLAEEYRLVVVEGRVAAGSLYKSHGEPCVDPDFPHDVLQAFVTALETRFRPASIYDVDVAMTGQGWRVVEYSTFNTSALHACDVGAVIDAVTASVDARTEAAIGKTS